MYILLILSSILNIMMISSVFWFTSWVILELTGFIFVMILSISRANSINKKACMWKYFLYQCMGSILLLMCLFMKVNQITYLASYTTDMIMLAGLMMKLGLPPFHKWSFEVSENLDWLKFTLINSIQKIPSLILIWKFIDMNWLVMLMLMFVMFFSLISLFDWSLRRFLMYSSLLNYVWIILCSSIDSMSMVIYMVVYLWTFTSVTLMLSKFSFSCFSFLFNNNSLLVPGSLVNIIMSTNIMSLAGLPPLAGFIVKYDILICLIWNCLIFLSIILMIISMIMLYMYMMLMICSTMTNKLVSGEFYTGKNLYMMMVCVMNLVTPALYIL